MKELMKVAYLAARSEFDMIPERREAAFEEWFAKQDISSLQSKRKTKEEVWEEVESYHRISGFAGNGRLKIAIFEAMEESAQSHANKDGWVSVEDRLPEKSGLYLVYKHTHAMIAYFKVEFGWGSIDENYPVTHWKPLPKNPKEV